MGRARPGAAPARRPRPAWGGGAAGLLLLAVGCAAPLPPAPTPAPEPASPAEPPPGVRVFTSDGTPTSWDALLDAARGVRVVLLGEFHNDEAGHRSRHALVRALAGGAALGEEGRAPAPGGSGDGGASREPECAPHVISLEMLEVDVQLVVDEYLTGLITRDHFLQSARPWSNHERDYEPYLEVARLCGFPVVAANPPRRYVNRVARLGVDSLEALSTEALATLPPLPVDPPSPRYRAEWDALMGRIPAHGDEETTDPPAHGDPPHSPEEEAPTAAHLHGGGAHEAPLDPILEAQNLWDAGMAWAVAEAARAHPGARLIHVAGIFHIQYGTGVPEHLDRYLPGVSRLLVTAFPVGDDTPFRPDVHGGSGDFVLLTPDGNSGGSR
jgi:uncharacterized iron-regulated protein